MKVLNHLKSVGLYEESQALISKFTTGNDAGASLKHINDSIDSSGLKSPKTAKLIGALQREGKLQPGLYKELVSLQTKLEEAPVPTPASTPVVASSAPAENNQGKDTMSEATTTTTEVQATPSTAGDQIVVVDGFQMTQKEADKLKAKVAKENERIQKRLATYKTKHIERLKARAEKSAQRQGMKLEEMQEVKELKEKLSINREQMKALRAEGKVHRDALKALRPKRKKKDEGAEAPAEAKADKKKAG